MLARATIGLGLLAGLIAAPAGAQIALEPLSLTTSDGLATYTFGAGGCNTMLQATWAATSLFGTPCGDMTMWLTSGECGDAAAAGDHPLDSVSSALVLTVKTGTFTVDLAQLPGFGSDDAGVTCGANGVSLTTKVCAAIALQNGFSCISNHAAPLEVDYDTQAPPSPSIDGVVAKDGALEISVSTSADTLYVQLDAQGPGETSFGHAIQVYVANSTKGVMNGLTNDAQYQLRAIAVDAAGNASAPSQLVPGTPLHTLGFWDNYRQDGGQAQGCSTSGAPRWPAPTLLLLLLARRLGALALTEVMVRSASRNARGAARCSTVSDDSRHRRRP